MYDNTLPNVTNRAGMDRVPVKAIGRLVTVCQVRNRFTRMSHLEANWDPLLGAGSRLESTGYHETLWNQLDVSWLRV